MHGSSFKDRHFVARELVKLFKLTSTKSIRLYFLDKIELES